MDQLGETYKVRRKQNYDSTIVVNLNFPKVRKCEDMWSLGTDRPGTPCAVKVKKHCCLGTIYNKYFDCRTLMDFGTEPVLKRF